MITGPHAVADNETLSFDLCVIGAGAVGISLALELADSSLRVGLLEAGGFEAPEIDSDHPYRGKVTGLPYSLEGSRLRYFGGTTNVWGGWCLPLDPLDFQARSYLPLSGWPLDYSEVLPYYRRAQQICEGDPPGFEYRDLQSRPPGEEFFATYDPDFSVRLLRYSPPTRFGVRYRSALEASPNVSCFLHSTVTELLLDKGEVTQVLVRSGEKTFRVEAPRYVLAAGGIENARLLLHSGRNGVGNESGYVGRCFADHVGALIGWMLASDNIPYTPYYEGATRVLPHLCFSEQFSLENQLLNCGLILGASQRRELLANDYLSSSILFPGWRGSPRSTFHGVVARMETAPNPESRVTLGPERDRYGVRRVVLDWRLSGMEMVCLERVARLLAAKVGRSNLGRFRQTFWGSQARESDLATQGHHMGTTRMSRNPGRGVVDSHCRVHTVANLYVSGSSVFPCFGFANPTLTIVALAVRLAEHLQESAES